MLKDIFDEKTFKELAGNRLELIKDIAKQISSIRTKVHDMVEARKIANKLEDVRDQAGEYSKNVAPYLEDIRSHIDKLELIVDDEIWPLPKYRELLFTK